MWHRVPKDDAWKQVTLASVAAMDQQIWLSCGICQHNVFVDGIAFGRAHGVDPNTPLLMIARRLKCSRCGERKGSCWPQPYRVGDKA